MLHVYHSNRLERLLERLLEVVAAPLPDPLSPEVIVTQSQGMARWLALGIAERQGIAANLDFALPAAFVWRTFAAQLEESGDSSIFDRETLKWRVMATLPAWLDQEGFEPLRRYLRGGRGELRRYQLARRIADVFDQYLIYRPEMVLDWEAGEGDDWQAQLWRALAADGKGHRAALLARFLALCDEGRLDAGKLPPRLSLFGISSLPPAYLEVLYRLSLHIDLHLFLMNPSLLYWGDIRDPRNLARLRRQRARSGRVEGDDYFTVGNPLLASFGRQGRDFVEMLHNYPSIVEEELFQEPAGQTLLAALQSDILLLEERGADGVKSPVGESDRSIRIHACHSPMREVELLHDQLLALFGDDSSLTARDVVVMVPEIEKYAAGIEAVFGAAQGARQIPWTIADLAARSEQPLLRAFLTLLDLPNGRFGAAEVLSFLELPAVLRRFGLDETEFETVRHWVVHSGIRWGLGDREGAAAGVEGSTWEDGFKRLFLGLALPPGAEPFANVAPYGHVEGKQAEPLGRLRSFVERLDEAAERLAVPATAREWAVRVNGMIETFFSPDEEEGEALQGLREALAGMVECADRAGYGESFGVEVLRDQLRGALEEAEIHQRFLDGRVTFCALIPMRSIPFKVVCLLGMNDQEFPRQRRPLGFDKMADRPRPGDRSRREEDRYLFLEALLSARQTLYISYVGRDPRDNAPLLPSVVVSDLLDYLEQGFSVPEGRLRDHLVTEQPLQPFSHRYFSGREPRLFSYAEEWLPAARARQGERRSAPPFCPQPLEDEKEGPEIELTDLLEFFRHPARAFLRRRLGLLLDVKEDIVEENEPFDLGYEGVQTLARRVLEGGTVEAALGRLRAEGALPAGHFGTFAVDEAGEGVEQFAERVRAFSTAPLAPLEVDLPLAGRRLRGWLEGVGAGGLLRYRFARLQAHDQIALWIRHLVINAVAPEGVVRESCHVARDAAFRLGPVGDARERLAELLDLYREGRRRPLPFFPRSAGAWAGGGGSMGEARKAWSGNRFMGVAGEGEDGYNRIAFRGGDPLGEEFERLAGRLFGPMLDSVME